MGILETVRTRRSVRIFRDDPVPDNCVADLIEALRWAPSAGNLESRKFFLVFNRRTRMHLSGATGRVELAARIKKVVKEVLGRNPVSSAPLVIVGCIDRRIYERYGERGEQLYAIQDVAVSLMNMMLVAHDRGLGTVWIGAFNEQSVATTLNLPDHLRPVALVPVGFPKVTPGTQNRRAAEETVEILR